MEIERKFLINTMPAHLDTFPCHILEQGYLCTNPVVRIRRQDNEFILTYKGAGMMAREEYNLPLNEASYYHLKEKVDGIMIAKKRYLIPIKDGLVVELDVFAPPIAPLVLAEVEFDTVEDAVAFSPPEWLGADVTNNTQYHNSTMSKFKG